MIKKKLGIVVALIALIVCGLSFLLMIKTSTDVLRKEYRMYDKYESYYFPKNTILSMNQDGSFLVDLGNDVKVDPEHFPLYSDGHSKILMSADYVYCRPDIANENLIRRKISIFTEMEDKDGYILISKGSSKSGEDEGILYDGDSAYILLEPMTLEYNDNIIDLAPLSFVRIYRGERIVYFNCADTKHVMDDFDGYVNLKCDKYTINLNMDSISYGSKETFVPSSIESLDDYFAGDK